VRSPDGYNSAHLLTAGGRRWLVLALDWRISDRGLTWAQGILDEHPRVPAIVTTHDLATPTTPGPRPSPRTASGCGTG
jgi:hypothetical protein